MTDLTDLLQDWGSAEPNVRSQVVEQIYAELRQIAARHLAGERANALVQPTMLVNEAYLKLSSLDRIQWQNRQHFLAMAARAMREFLVDEARRRTSQKRDGGLQVTMSDALHQQSAPKTDMLALNEALDRLAAADPERALLVELRFFGGLTVDEVATLMNKSPATVKRSWQVARAWLYQQMNADAPS
ncbi:MAG: ECF-type sigma factor [Pseudomonadota bacterium]